MNFPTDVLTVIFSKIPARDVFTQHLFLVCKHFKNAFTSDEGSCRLNPFVPFDATDIIISFKTNNLPFIKFHFQHSVEDRNDESLSVVAAQTSHTLFDLVIEFNWKMCLEAFYEIGKSRNLEYMKSLFKIFGLLSPVMNKMIRSGFIKGAASKHQDASEDVSEDDYGPILIEFAFMPSLDINFS
jgi:hypothetical protein